MNKKRYIRFSLVGGGSVLMSADDTEWLKYELEEAAPGEKYTVEIVEMTEEEYSELPEFDGF